MDWKRFFLALSAAFAVFVPLANAQPTPNNGEVVLYHNFRCNPNIGWRHVTTPEQNFCGLRWSGFPFGGVNDNVCSIVIGPFTGVRLLEHCNRNSGTMFEYSNMESNAVCIPVLPNFFVYSYSLVEDLAVQPVAGETCRWEKIVDLGTSNSGSTTRFASAGDNLQFIRHSEIVDNMARIYRARNSQTGAVWYTHAVNPAGGFVTEFSFRFRENGGWFLPAGADGLAFVIQSQGNRAIGGGGGQMGYQGIRDAIIVEFDTWYNNWSPIGDPFNNHIAILARGRGQSASAGHQFALASHEYPGHNLENADSVTARVTYFKSGNTWKLRAQAWTNGFLGQPTAEVEKNMQLENYMSMPYGTAFIGFTGATGGNWQDLRVTSWEYSESSLAMSDAIELSGVDSEVRADDTSEFTINLRGACGKLYFAEASDITVTCGSQCTGAVRPQNAFNGRTGTFIGSVAMEATATGSRTVTVSYSGQSESFTIDIINLGVETVEFLGGPIYSTMAGRSATFRVQVIGINGIPLSNEPEDSIEVVVRPANGDAPLVLTSEYASSGQYEYTWTGYVAGTGFTAHATINGAIVQGNGASSAELHVFPGPLDLEDRKSVV